MCEPIYSAAIAVPCQVPEVIVPTVEILEEPVQVDNLVFSTFPNPTVALLKVAHVGADEPFDFRY